MHITFYLQMTVGACPCNFVDLIAFDKNHQKYDTLQNIVAAVTCNFLATMLTNDVIWSEKIQSRLRTCIAGRNAIILKCPHLQIPHTHSYIIQKVMTKFPVMFAKKKNVCGKEEFLKKFNSRKFFANF